MKKSLLFSLTVLLSTGVFAVAKLHNEYSFLQEVTFELYTDEIPQYKAPEQMKSIEEVLMFDVLHAVWLDKKWVAYTLNKNLLGTYKVGQPALLDNDDTKKIFFVASFPGSFGGLDLYTSEYENGAWSKPKNLGKTINTTKNESNPGLLNTYTLTYSSGGIIKKLDLKTLKVVDLEEAGTAPSKSDVALPNTLNQTAEQPVTQPVSAPVVKETMVIKEQPAAVQTPAPVVQPAAASTSNGTVSMLGNKTREEMTKQFPAAIQLGAFSAPKWDAFNQFSKFGKVVSYKNEKNINVVWITGFASRAAAEAVLPQVKSIAGFESAYVTGK
jgi:hypothetical protein